VAQPARALPVRRRAVLTAGAWAAPAVVMATPLPSFAASPECFSVLNYSLDWDSLALGTVVSSANATAAGGTPVPVTVASVFVGLARTRTGNRTVAGTDVGGSGGRALFVTQTMSAPQSSRANRQELTLSFGRPVTNLTFTITDIDVGPFQDLVDSSTVPSSQSKPGTVTGQGTAADPWVSSGSSDVPDDGSNEGNVTLTFGFSLTSLTLNYWNGTGAAEQGIYLTDLTFNATAC
jgi:hypothetical protein